MPTTSPGFRANLPDLGEAPELNNEVWLNTDRPLRLADLRGKVVVLDMWTFGCINCRNVIPSLREWHTKYAEQGLVVIGNHFPEFDYERDLNNLKDALQRLNVPYAVAQDNDGSDVAGLSDAVLAVAVSDRQARPSAIHSHRRGGLRGNRTGYSRFAQGRLRRERD